MQRSSMIVVSACALGLVRLALGQSDQKANQPPAAAPAVSEAAPDKLNLSVAPYIWLTGMSGDVTMRNIKFHSDVSFGDILDNTDQVLGFMGALDLEYKRFVFQLNGAWTQAKVDNTKALTANGTLNADVKLSNAWFELFGGYRVLERPLGDDPASKRKASVDVFGGARFTDINADTTLTATQTITLPNGDVLTNSQSRDWDGSKSWVEPFLGARLNVDFSEHWLMMLRGDIGGFGIDGSSFSWQAVAAIGYRWKLDNWELTAFGGYRALGQDYAKGNFAWDMVTHGPILGAAAAWSF